MAGTPTSVAASGVVCGQSSTPASTSTTPVRSPSSSGSGPPVLFYWPSATHRDSALRLYGVRRDRSKGADTAVHVVVDASRTVTRVPGVEVERVRNVRSWLDGYRYPPRVKVEFALLKVASDRDLEGAVAVLADACAQEKTTPDLLVEAPAEAHATPRPAGTARDPRRRRLRRTLRP